MVFSPEPVFRAVELFDSPRPLFLLSPSGRRFDQEMARDLATKKGSFSLLCGRYEGVDERIARHLVDGEISIGDFVLGGGELACLVVIEAVARLVTGVIGNEASSLEESFSKGLLEYPHYTRPAMFRDWSVPEVLLSGDHARIARWRAAEALWRTIVRRPDLIAARGGLDGAEVELLAEHGYPQEPAEVPESNMARTAGDDGIEERGTT
jgi:tRNA (guanine37-N1)-methyltransferase